MRALHLAAQVALRGRSPVAAKQIVDRLGRAMRPFRSVEEALEAHEILRGRGACLTRALAVASRAPGAEVVIGVNPRQSAHLVAHAWIEVGGVTIGERQGPSAGAITELARLR
jgi:hypothetical protein